MYACHSFLIRSPADGHLVCFHVLAIVNSTAMNIGVHVFFFYVSFSILVSSGYMPSSGMEETHLYLWSIHIDIWQKPLQYCKVIILQLNEYLKNFF